LEIHTAKLKNLSPEALALASKNKPIA